MPKKRIIGRKFRGPTPRNYFQTVSVGEGAGWYLERQAKKHPKRKYLAVDPYPVREIDETTAREAIRRLQKAGVQVLRERIIPAMDKLIRQRKKVRHFNIDMPNTEEEHAPFGFNQFFEKAKKLLLPNGKVFVTSTDTEFLERLAQKARASGFSTRRPFQMHERSLRKTQWILDVYTHTDQIPSILECTLRLKTVFPKKWQRKR